MSLVIYFSLILLMIALVVSINTLTKKQFSLNLWLLNFYRIQRFCSSRMGPFTPPSTVIKIYLNYISQIISPSTTFIIILYAVVFKSDLQVKIQVCCTLYWPFMIFLISLFGNKLILNVLSFLYEQFPSVFLIGKIWKQ